MPLHGNSLPSDLKSVGDVRQLQGRIVEIHGQVKEYDGRAEIILEEYRQLSGSTARIPPLPKNYDVENKGRYSAGTSPKSRKATFEEEENRKATDRSAGRLRIRICRVDTLVRCL